MAPLDWGLGHTTRCIPVIRCLQGLGHKVLFAGNAAQRSFIKENFEGIDFIHLDGYAITYSRRNKWLQAGLLLQIPGILRKIRAEHEWLKKLCGERQIDGIISDNRYGLWHESVPSVIMTHQLRVKTGLGNMADGAVQRTHYRMLNRFGATWVADAPDDANLAGELSHPKVLPHTASYIGLLSRFANDGISRVEPVYEKLLILISGPEPQRTEFSQMLWRQAVKYGGPVTFVEGSEDAPAPAIIPAHITYHRRIAGPALEGLIREASVVVCRSGYSTIMDLVALGKKAVLIPTPGQTEQEYLARRMRECGYFFSIRQDDMNIAEVVAHNGQQPALSKNDIPLPPSPAHNANAKGGIRHQAHLASDHFSGFQKAVDEAQAFGPPRGIQSGFRMHEEVIRDWTRQL